MVVRDLQKRFAHQLTFLLLATTLAAGCAEPVDEASDGFKRCMEGAGFELQGQDTCLQSHNSPPRPVRWRCHAFSGSRAGSAGPCSWRAEPCISITLRFHSAWS